MDGGAVQIIHMGRPPKLTTTSAKLIGTRQGGVGFDIRRTVAR